MNRELAISYLFKQITIINDKTLNKGFESFDITFTQFKILKYLLYFSDKVITQKDIEKHFGISNPTVTGVLDRLEEKKLLERVEVPTDRRKKAIVITAKGRGLLKETKAIFDRQEELFTKNFSDNDLKQLREYLYKIKNNLED